MAIKATVRHKDAIPTLRNVMNIVKEAVHETENCSHNDHGDVDVFLTRVESKLIMLYSKYGTTDSIIG